MISQTASQSPQSAIQPGSTMELRIMPISTISASQPANQPACLHYLQSCCTVPSNPFFSLLSFLSFPSNLSWSCCFKSCAYRIRFPLCMSHLFHVFLLVSMLSLLHIFISPNMLLWLSYFPWFALSPISHCCNYVALWQVIYQDLSVIICRLMLTNGAWKHFYCSGKKKKTTQCTINDTIKMNCSQHIHSSCIKQVYCKTILG